MWFGYGLVVYVGVFVVIIFIVVVIDVDGLMDVGDLFKLVVEFDKGVDLVIGWWWLVVGLYWLWVVWVGIVVMSWWLCICYCLLVYDIVFMWVVW